MGLRGLAGFLLFTPFVMLNEVKHLLFDMQMDE
jgi:hypothetical protein